MISQLSYPAIFAHRGSSAYAPENTIAAFQLAVKQEADAVELDVQLTADQHVVVFHDLSIERITSKKGDIKDLNLAQIRELEAGSHFDLAFKGEPIPTLGEVFENVGKSTFINIELKNHTTPTNDLPDKVTDVVKKHGMEARVLFSSFNPIALIRIHRLLPNVPIGLLALRGWRGSLTRSWIGQRICPYQSLHPEFHDITNRMLHHAHFHGYKVFTYSVDREEDMRYLFALGVDGIITSDPVLASRVVKNIPR